MKSIIEKSMAFFSYTKWQEQLILIAKCYYCSDLMRVLELHDSTF